MVDFPPNLDDGELWLPSDIFPDEGSSMENITHHFATFTLNHPTFNNPPSKLERFRPPVRSVPFSPSSSGYFAVNGNTLGVGQSFVSYKTRSFSSGPSQLSLFHLLEPAQYQVDSIFQLRARVLKRQQNWSRNQFLPIRGSGGTGVFLPRVSTANTTTANKRRQQQWAENKHGIQMIQQGNSINMVATGKLEDCHYQLSPETVLPQEWTY